MEVKAFEPATRLKYGAALLCIVFIIGTLGFHFIEDWTYLDSFFMTLITITTIGYQEIHPLTEEGKVFDIFRMEGFKIREECRLVGKTLKDAPIRKDRGLIVVAVSDHTGKMIFNPVAELKISVDDVLVCIGDTESLQSMKTLVSS